MQIHSPKEIIDNNMSGAIKKANMPLCKNDGLRYTSWNVYCGRWCYK